MAGAGARDRLIRLERASFEQSESSGDTTIASWDLVEEVWADVRSPQGREALQAQGVVAKVDTIFRIGYRTDISASEEFSIVHEGRRYDIVPPLAEPNNAPRRSALDVYAVARAEATVRPENPPA